MVTATPWGKSEQTNKLAPGITYYSTAKGGGYKVSDKKYAEMPEPLRSISQPWTQWFEHDRSWAAVALAFPQYFPPTDISAAKEVVKEDYPKVFAKLYKRKK